MADLYSVFPGIQVSENEILEAELIATQILQAKYPNLDLREGTGLRDLNIRPAATLLAMMQKAGVFLFAQNSLSGATDDTPNELVDKLMSNWFLERKQGSKAIINARLFFAKQKEIIIPADAFFSTDNTLKFFPATTFSVPNGQLTFDAFSNEYFYDLDLTAEAEGTDYNISSGSLLYFSNFDPFFLRAEINFLKAVAIKTETNLEFIDRASTGISTRNLINTPSISSKMLEDFPLLAGVTSIGMGDPEMIRDQVWTYVPALTPPTVLIHNGGFVDIYSRVPLATGVVQIATDANGKAKLGGAIYEFKRSQIAGSGVDDSIPFYDARTVTTITRTSTTATVTMALAHGYTTGNSILIAGATPAGYNGTFIITVTGANTFTYPVPNTLATPATGTITANKELAYTTTIDQQEIRTLTSLTQSAGVATATLNNHGLAVDRWILITGATPSGYNGWFKITNATANNFTYSCSAGLSSPATGTIGVSSTIPAQDWGFSDKSVRTIDFGGAQASKTASFEIKYFQDIDGLQEYLEDDVRRVLCAGYLARGYNIYLLTVNITGYNGPAPDAVTCSDVVTKYLADLAPGELFVMADLTAQLNAAGVVTIKTPLDVTYRYFQRDLGPYVTGTITDFHDSNDRTAIYILETLTTSNQTI
jgi:hypothetical protein